MAKPVYLSSLIRPVTFPDLSCDRVRFDRSNLLLVVVFTAILIGTKLCSAQPNAAPQTAQHLLVDDQMLTGHSNVRRVLGTPVKSNSGQPIFTAGWFYGTVLHDEGRFKLWFRKPSNQGYGYAESSDGLQFQIKSDVSGINFAGDYTLAVEIDSHETEPAHRFKAAYDAPGMAAGIAHSADGIRWTPYNQGQPVTSRAADTYNHLLWDPLRKTYRLFTRTDFGTAGGTGEIRGTRSMINPDVKRKPTNFQLVREWIFDRDGQAESQRRQIYAATCWIYRDIYFALLTVYEHPGDVSEGRTTEHGTRHERDVMNFYIATSRDGDRWDLQWVYAGQPMISRGPAGSFDMDILLPASTIVTVGDEHWLYYSGANERHGTEAVRFDRQHAIGLAKLPRDRFIGLAADDEQGTIVTKPWKLTDPKVTLNIKAKNIHAMNLDNRKLNTINTDARAGACTVEVLDEQGQPIPEYSGDQSLAIEGVDALDFQPRWRQHADLSKLVGRTIQLRIRLRNAVVFAYHAQ